MWQRPPALAGADAPERPAEAAAGDPAPLEPLVLRGDGALAVVSVADERGESREAVRAVLAAAASGAACWDCAVVVPHGDDVERFATALRAAGVPVACRLPDRSEAGRVLRRIADCLAPPAGEAFARRAVVDLLSAAPLRHAAPAADLRRSGWTRPVRRAWSAGSSCGSQRVRRRRGGLERRVTELEARASEALEVDDEDEIDARLEPVRLRLQAARALEAAVVTLARACGGLPQRASWGMWADALAAFATELFAAPVAAAVGDLAGRLRALDILHEEVATGEMAAVLRELLVDDRAPVGRAGRDGVAVLTPLELRGLRFHTVVFTGLAEGGFPARGRPDPVLGDAERRRLAEALGARLPLAEQRDAEATLLFAFACEAARERLVLLAPRGDAATGRPRLPSRLLLRLASLAAGHPVGLDELLGGEPLRPVWRRVAGGPSYDDAAAMWVDARERDAAALLALAPRSRTSARAYLAALLRESGAAERRLAQWHAGRSPEPGAWDGLLGDEARAALAARHPFLAEVHPTRLERYVSCPFAFFLRDVLDLQAPEEPGDSLEIDAREFGTLAHDILQRTYEAVVAGDLDREAALAAVVSAWEEACTAAEQRGVTGAAVAWEVRRAVLLEDLLESVRRDQVFSRDDERPVAVEWRFGEAAGRPVALDVPGGRRVRFAGRLDRIDTTGRGARVIDYKTGAGRTEDERIKAGLSVQLPVYQLAVRQAGGERYAQVASLYRLVTRRGGFKDLPLPGDEDAAAAQLRALVAEAMTLIDAGLFPRTSKAGCDYCELGYACGLSAWTRARKREHESLADVVALQTEGPDGGAHDA